MTALRRDGTEFPVEITISALRQDEGWLFSAFVQDMSRRVAGRARSASGWSVRYGVRCTAASDALTPSSAR